MTNGRSSLPKISMAGASAVLLDAAEDVFLAHVQERIWSVAEAMSGGEGICETVPGVNNLLVVFDPQTTAPHQVEADLLRLWHMRVSRAQAGREIEVAVIYGGSTGEDLPCLAEFAGMTEEEVVHRHAEPVYSVAAVGALPGFVYLSGIDPRIARPRRDVPRMRVESGSVMIGGPQAGIMPCTAPSGWHIIGRTDISMFDASRVPPATLMPGDRLRFRIAGIDK
jgi:KipI family sensor histidine kinase inhibitor